MVVRLLYNFTMELDAESVDWTDQRAYWTWERRPLWVRLTAREGVKIREYKRSEEAEEKET